MLPARRSCVQSSETDVSATNAVTGRARNMGICGRRGVRHADTRAARVAAPSTAYRGSSRNAFSSATSTGIRNGAAASSATGTTAGSAREREGEQRRPRPRRRPRAPIAAGFSDSLRSVLSASATPNSASAAASSAMPPRGRGGVAAGARARPRRHRATRRSGRDHRGSRGECTAIAADAATNSA